MPVRSPPRPVAVAPVFSWTGFYIGGNVGYGWGDTDGVFFASRSLDGWLGGIQGGFNYQFPASGFVIGIEADYQWADISGSAGFATVDRFGTVRGHLGFAWDRFMVYGTGGWAFEANTEVNLGLGLGASRSLDGWTAGAGIEWAFAPNWSAKLEYLHIDLESNSFFAPAVCFPAVSCQTGADIDLVRVGLNWRFGGFFGAP
jgi:outer membrane immunogenic protein